MRKPRNDLLCGATMHREGFGVRKAPSHAGGGHLKRAELRVEGDLLWRDMVGVFRVDDARAHAEPERIAGGENNDAAALVGLEGFDQRIKGRWPFYALGSGYTHQLMMPVAADDHLGAFDQRARGGRQPRETILANSDDMKPRFFK